MSSTTLTGLRPQPSTAVPSPRSLPRTDRRARPTPALCRWTLVRGQRRRGGRRAGENVAAYVDLHGAGLFAVVTAIVALNFLDAWFTVLFLSHGGTELNPLVEGMLSWGTWPFVLAKSAGIGLCVAVLTVTKNFGVARAGLTVVCLGYLALLAWHLSLLGHVPE